MSCFIVKQETIDILTTAIIALYAREKAAFKAFNVKSADQLGQALWDLNHDAYANRYSEQVSYLPYTFRHAKASKAQAIKCFDCLIYQCQEGDVETELYKKLDLERIKLLKAFVYASPEYIEAEWG